MRYSMNQMHWRNFFLIQKESKLLDLLSQVKSAYTFYEKYLKIVNNWLKIITLPTYLIPDARESENFEYKKNLDFCVNYLKQ